MDQEDALRELRGRIDEVDAALVELLSRRAELAERVGAIKDQARSAVIYRPEREAELLRRVRALNCGPLSDAALAHLFREVISACRALERELRVAFVAGEAAIRHHFGSQVTTVAVDNAAVLFDCVASGSADYGVLPEPLAGCTLPAAWLTPGSQACSVTSTDSDAAGGSGRLLVFGQQQTRPTGQDETAVLIPDPRSGAGGTQHGEVPTPKFSVDCRLAPDRPIRYAVYEGHPADSRYAPGFAALRAGAPGIVVLGSFPSPVDG